MDAIDPRFAAFTSYMQLVVWFIQGWSLCLVASIIALSLVFLRYGEKTEQRAAGLIAFLRVVIRVFGGPLLLTGVRRHFPEMHDSMFGARESTGSDGLKHRTVVVWWILGVGIFVLLGISNPANAQEVKPLNAGLFDEIGNFYVEQAKALAAILRPLALSLFGSLSVISLALFLYRQALLGEGNLPAFVARFALEILKVGFFLYLVQRGPELVMQFLGYFTEAGSRAGNTGPLSASMIVVLGFDSCFRIFDAIGAMGWGDTAAFGLPLALAGLLILACFSLVGVLFLVRMIELHLVVYGGILLLGFGGISFTRDIPKNYLAYVISAGTQLFMLYVIIGLGMQLAQSWPSALTAAAGGQEILHQALYVLVSAATFASLAWSIPKVASSLVSGSISMGAADAVAPAATAAGGVAVAATGGAAAVAGLSQATTGAIQVQSAGMALATQQGSSGIGGAIKGLGHAANAIRTEAGAAAKTSLGLSPPSPNAEDRRGRSIGNIGTRAANRLSGELQATKEQAAVGSSEQSSAAKMGDFNTREGHSGRPNSLRPPPLPPDAAAGNVPINFNSDD